ncbi:hypothetical protein [Gemmatimonas sp.]
MSPLSLDPEQSASVVSAGQWSVKAFAESALAYLATALVGWLASRVLVGRRIAQLESSHERSLTEMEERIMEKLNGLAADHAALAQEVWGAQQQNGLRGEVAKIKDLQQRHGETLASIKAMLEVLLKQHT